MPSLYRQAYRMQKGMLGITSEHQDMHACWHATWHMVITGSHESPEMATQAMLHKHMQCICYRHGLYTQRAGSCKVHVCSQVCRFKVLFCSFSVAAMHVTAGSTDASHAITGHHACHRLITSPPSSLLLPLTETLLLAVL